MILVMSRLNQNYTILIGKLILHNYFDLFSSENFTEKKILTQSIVCDPHPGIILQFMMPKNLSYTVAGVCHAQKIVEKAIQRLAYVFFILK